MTEKIDIKQFDLDNEKVSEPIRLYVELSERYLLYVGEYYAEEPVAEDSEDHSLGWKDKYANFRIKIKKEQLVSLECQWIEKRQLWNVEIEANGYPNTIRFYFKTEKEADVMFNRLDDYIFNNK